MKIFLSLVVAAFIASTASTANAAASRTIDAALISNGAATITLPTTTGTLCGKDETCTLTNKSLTAPSISSPTGLVKADVGLSNVDNTSDATKNSATATLTNKTLTSPVINSPTGLVKADVGLSNVDNTSDANKPVSTAVSTALGLKVNTSAVGANNGVASLDSGGKIPSSQLPNTVMEYQGNWNASTNSPSLADGTGNAGDVYRVNTAGSQDLGSGSQTFAVGDWVVYNGSIWQLSVNSNAVMSVNGQTGTVVLTKSDVGLGNVDNTSDATKNSATATLTNKTISGSSNTLTVLAGSQLSGQTPVANGGTGLASLTSGSVLVGNGTSAASLVAPGTSGNVLTSNGSTWVSSAAAALPSVTGSQASPTSITAAGGVSFSGSNYFNYNFIAGNGGAVTVTANPQVAAASSVGQKLTLIGTSASNTVSFADGNGLSLNGAWVASDNAALDLVWNGSVWTETARR